MNDKFHQFFQRTTEQEIALETLLAKIDEFNDISPCETCGGCWCDTCEFGGENDDED